MKTGIHPENYRLVAFKDMSNDDIFITKSTAETKETIKVEGVEYPLVKLEISRTSHPYYTGKSKLVDTAGRIDKFKNRYGNLKKKEAVTENNEVEKEDKVSKSQKKMSDQTENKNTVKEGQKEVKVDNVEEDSKIDQSEEKELSSLPESDSNNGADSSEPNEEQKEVKVDNVEEDSKIDQSEKKESNSLPKSESNAAADNSKSKEDQ